MNTNHPTSYGYSRKHRALEVLCIVTVAGLLLGFCVQVSRTIHTPVGWVSVALTGFTAYVASDVMTGIAHWGGDTIGDESLWFFGPNFIRPFREHHIDQQAITRHDFIETNGNNCIGMSVPLALAFVFLPAREGWRFFAMTFVAFLSLFMVATNQFHKWAHADSAPAMVRWLQRWSLILSPSHHQVHHARPHDQQYCITVGWMNPVLNAIKFFRAAEWVIARHRPSWLHIDERKSFAAAVQATKALESAAAAPAAAAATSPRPGTWRS